MGFYGPVPCKAAKAHFVDEGGDYGAFVVTAEGDAKEFTAGITLVRDAHFVGGLRLNVMGWVGPLAEGTQTYRVHGTFPGAFMPVIIVGGHRVEVKRTPDEQLAEAMAGAR